MNYKDFDSAYTHVKAYKISCVICKISKPKSSEELRAPYFIIPLDRFNPSISRKAIIEACFMFDVDVSTGVPVYGPGVFTKMLFKPPYSLNKRRDYENK